MSFIFVYTAIVSEEKRMESGRKSYINNITACKYLTYRFISIKYIDGVCNYCLNDACSARFLFDFE